MKFIKAGTSVALLRKGIGTSIFTLLTACALIESAQGATDLIWRGGTDPNTGNDWTAPNVWVKNNPGQPVQTFQDADTVTFDNSSTVRLIDVNATVAPGTLTISSGVTGTGYQFNQASGSITTSGLISISSSLTLNANSTTALLGSNSTANNAITVNSGGSLILAGAGNNVADTTKITLSGGSIQTPNGGSESLGALTLTTSTTSSLDFSVTPSSLLFASISGSGTLNVFNFTQGQDHLFLGQPSTATINFYSGGDTNSSPVVYSAEVVPEPSTILAGLGLVGFLGWRERRRISSLFKRQQSEEAFATA